MIDGGSTGTRIHVFEFSAEGGIPVLEMVGSGESVVVSMKVSPGLSDYAEDVDGAGRSIAELLEFGKGKVPKERWEETEVRLMATAGLRRLEVAAQERVLESCRRVLRSSGFRFQDDWASVISGMGFSHALYYFYPLFFLFFVLLVNAHVFLHLYI